jgi:hypothetical protein
VTFGTPFASIAQMPNDAAMETLLFLRSRGYSVDKLARTTGLPQARIEELLMVGICRLINKMKWPRARVAKVYRFSDLTIDSVLRAAAKRSASTAVRADVSNTTRNK